MAYGVTTAGFVIKPAATIREEVETYQRTNIDPGLTLTERSTMGAQNTSVINQCAELWELGQAVYNSTYPDSATGWSLDQSVAMTGTKRDTNTKTVVTGQVTMNPDKALPAGSVAHLTNQPNQRFITLAEVPADPAGGTFSVSFEAETAGAIQVAIGQLSGIAEPVSGWTAVTNAAAGATGDARDEDDELRLKQQNELRATGSTNTEAIRTGLLTLDGVVDAVVFENVKGYFQNGMFAHSIYAVVRGGTSSEIAQKIFDKNAGGTDTNGSESNTITDSKDQTHTILHDFATELTFYATMAIDVTDDFDTVAGPAEIKTNVQTYINSLGTGGDVIYDEIKYAAYSVDGVYKVTSLVIDYSTPPASTTDLTTGITEFPTCDIANVSVTVNP